MPSQPGQGFARPNRTWDRSVLLSHMLASHLRGIVFAPAQSTLNPRTTDADRYRNQAVSIHNMKTVPTTNIAVGSVLSADAASPQGMTIARKGTAVTEKHLKAFKAWGITEVCIDDPTCSGQAADQPAVESEEVSLPNAAIEELAELFSQTNLNHPAMAELMRLATNRYLKDPNKDTGPEV